MRLSRLIAPFLFGIPAAFAQSWVPTYRAEVRVIQDSNVFLQDDVPLASDQTKRMSPVRADDQVFVGAAGIAWARKPAPGGTAVDLGYSVEWFRFAEQTDESHIDHRLSAAAKRVLADWALDAKATLLEIDGSHENAVYNEIGGTPAMGGEPVRSRRAQATSTFAGAALWQPAALRWRGRAIASVLHQDFKTRQDTVPWGCTNNVDRGQGLAGIEGGRVLQGDVIAWLSFRAGRQWQSNLLGRPENFTSTIIRPLIGVEGTLLPKVRMSAWAGPSYHSFTAERRAGTEAHRTIPYFETAVAWTPRASDTVSFSGRHHLWPGSGGRSAYREVKVDATWTHRFPGKTELASRASLLHGNFSGFAATFRHETVYLLGSVLSRPLGARLRGEVGLTREWSDTEIPHTNGRAYHRWLTHVAVSRSW